MIDFRWTISASSAVSMVAVARPYGSPRKSPTKPRVTSSRPSFAFVERLAIESFIARASLLRGHGLLNPRCAGKAAHRHQDHREDHEAVRHVELWGSVTLPIAVAV